MSIKLITSKNQPMIFCKIMNMDDINTNDDIHEEITLIGSTSHIKAKPDRNLKQKLRGRESRENFNLKKFNKKLESADREMNFNGFLFKRPHIMPKITANERQIVEQNLRIKEKDDNKLKILHEPLNKIEVIEEVKLLTPDILNEPDIALIFCAICFSTVIEYEQLGCTHTFCRNCIVLLFEDYINIGRIMPEEILCPSCSTAISDTLVNKYISLEQQAKIIELRIHLKTQKLVADNKAVHCPVPDCKGFGHISPIDTHTACTDCKAGICVPCKNGAHPGMTCDDYMSQYAEFKIDEMLLSRNWKRCPKCGAACMREDGCNYVICQSPVCRGTQPFCNLCGKPLVQKQHFSHFLAQGPFGNICNTLDGTPEPPA